MWLTATSQSFEIVLGEAENTPSRWWVSYRDSNLALPQTAEGASNGTTPATALSGPSTGRREVVRFCWHNADNITHTAKVRQDVSGTRYTEPGFLAIPVGSSLWYHELRGWYVFPQATAAVTAFCSQVVAVSSSNLTLSGVPAAQDGITVAAGQRILLSGQTTTSENGVWVVQAGAWGRPAEYASNATLLPGYMVGVGFGTLQAKYIWLGARSDGGQGSFVVDADGTSWVRLQVTMQGVGAPSDAIGSPGAAYLDMSDPTNPQLYYWQ